MSTSMPVTTTASVAAGMSAAQPSPDTLLDIRSLSVEVPVGQGLWVPAVDEVTLQVGAGETVGLVGESGSGKTLVSMALMGLAPAVGARIGAGQVLWDGVDLAAGGAKAWQPVRGKQLSMVFQQPMRSLNPAFTVGEQIAESARLHLGLSRRDARRRAVEMLDMVQIPDATHRVDQYPHEFSGGMCQRVMIAMAMVTSPRLLIADEPTTALDVTVQARILDLIADLQRETGIGVLLISHDLGVINQVCDRAVVMYAGQTIESGAVGEVFSTPRHPYTSALLGAAGRPGPDGRLRTLEGSVPRVGEAPAGCRFAPRCEFATEACVVPERVPFEAHVPHPTRCHRSDLLTLEGVRP